MLERIAFYEGLLAYLRSTPQKRKLRALLPTAAPEHWLSLEAAAWLDEPCNRIACGIGDEKDTPIPEWLVAAERHKVDLWIARGDHGAEEQATAVEFKVVHNNQGYRQQIFDMRRDLAKPLRAGSKCELVRVGVVLLVYSRFLAEQKGGYQTLRHSREAVSFDRFLRLVRQRLALPAPDGQCLRVMRGPDQLCTLDNARYMENGQGAQAALLLVELAPADAPPLPSPLRPGDTCAGTLCIHHGARDWPARVTRCEAGATGLTIAFQDSQGDAYSGTIHATAVPHGAHYAGNASFTRRDGGVTRATVSFSIDADDDGATLTLNGSWLDEGDPVDDPYILEADLMRTG